MSEAEAKTACARPYPTLEAALAAAVALARGGWVVILDAPTRAGDVWTMARVQDRATGTVLGHLRYLG